MTKGKKIGRLSRDDDRVLGTSSGLFGGIVQVARNMMGYLGFHISDPDVHDAVMEDLQAIEDKAMRGNKLLTGEIERRRRAARGDD